MAHRWKVRVRGNVSAPFADVVSWWTAGERTKDLRCRLERRVGEKARVVWSEGHVGADSWVEARWEAPRRPDESCWRLVRHEPQVVDGQPAQVRLTASLTTEGSTRRRKRVTTDSHIETLFLDRDRITEVRLRHSWTSTGDGIWRQLLTRPKLASVAKADLADMMLRCQASVRDREPAGG